MCCARLLLCIFDIFAFECTALVDLRLLLRLGAGFVNRLRRLLSRVRRAFPSQFGTSTFPGLTDCEVQAYAHRKQFCRVDSGYNCAQLE